METEGWLFDVYPWQSAMVLWIYGDDGGMLRLEDPYRHHIYARGRKEDLEELLSLLRKRRLLLGFGWARKQDFWSGQEMDVLDLEMGSSDHVPGLFRLLAGFEDRITFYNCDIPLAQSYLYEKGLFPTGRCWVEHEDGRVLRIEPRCSSWEIEYTLPPLRIMEIRIEGNPLLPFGRGNTLVVECEGYRLEIDPQLPSDVPLQINALLERFDPDVILTEHGDSHIVPSSVRMSRREKIPLILDREPGLVHRIPDLKGRSYFSYGRILYHSPAYPLFGRWHIDRANSFLFGESGFEGIIDLARLSKVPVQRAARTSPGTIITSMQLDRAFGEGILIPWRKGEPEKFKTAWDLLVADKGGLVFQPPQGIHKDIAEIDFASMYPTIMAVHNISPETVLCACCSNSRVPEAGYNICEKREGLIPRTLKPILRRRRMLKEMSKKMGGQRGENYRRRHIALKWILVTSFGYLGYRNARFGRIEAHEAVTAFGREKLLQAKEIGERRGFRLIHAITDSLWISKDSLTEGEVLVLCEEITREAGIPMNLEGIYRWMVFLPSRVKPELSVANRYFGLFEDGEIKARGLAFRRSDMPAMVREAQLSMLEVLSRAKDVDGYRSKIPEVFEVLLDFVLKLRNGEVEPSELVISKTLSQDPSDYKVDNLTALATQQLEDVGVRIHPGERVPYVIRDARSKVKEDRVRAAPLIGPEDGYDEEKYTELLLKAAEEVLIPFGYDMSLLRRLVDFSQKHEKEGSLGSLCKNIP
jgi:DNA polymerase elongation subunit (family B)